MARRIDDHSFWAGGKSKGSPFPEGAKVKTMRSAEGAGDLRDYPDDEQEVLRDQEGGVRKIDSKPMKPGYRY